MEKDHLGFTCPRCGTDLVVPASAAGAEGPCPRCGEVIRAPRFVMPKVEEPVRLEVPAEKEISRAKPVIAFQQAPAIPAPVFVAPRREKKRWVKIGAGCVLLMALVAAVAWTVRAGRKMEPAVKSAPAYSVRPKEKPGDPPVAPPEAKGTEPLNPALDPKVPPEGMDVGLVITRSAEVLGRFLAAKKLDDRLPWMESETPEAEMAESVLAGPLPVSSSFKSTEVRFNKVEGATDVAFLATFEKEIGADESHLLLVRTRGTQDPKVVVDPFLDGYGGRLAEFSRRPNKGERKFRIVMTVFDFCTDETVPDRESKFTLKMSSHPGGHDIAKAYFGKHSPLAERLAKSQVVYGRSIGATIVLRWTEGPQPFIEVVDVRKLGWED